VASTNSIVDSRFWDRVVLQACHNEPAIKHAVLALSSLHQLSSLPHDNETSYQHRLYAERQHHKALEEASVLIASSQPQDVDRILIACIIFIIFENVRGNYRAAAMHMDSGRAIVAQNSQRLKSTARRKDLVEIEHALARLDLPAICFSDRSSPYRYTLNDFYQTNPILSPDQFQDIQEAHACFIDLARWLLVLANHIDFESHHGDLQSMARYQAEKVRCSSALEQWHEYFLSAIKRADSSESLLIVNLKLWYALMALYSRAETYGPEMRYDALVSYFEEIVQHGEQLSEALANPAQNRSFSFDLGYMIPVYFTATRCRDPYIRRRAIRLLHTFPRQEGVWESTAAAAVAAKWMSVEEDGLVDVRSAADVPEHKRIRYIDTQVDVDSKSANVKFAASPGEGRIEVSASWRPEPSDAGTPMPMQEPA
jgi:cholestenol Delta-isomerase